MPIKINEIFYSIQGESVYTGIPCIFIRLTGCNLRCSYCDTRYAYDKGIQYTIPEIVEKIKKYRCPVVQITGGEPLLQDETHLLINRLIEIGYQVLLETNGSFQVSHLNEKCIKIIDIKCPSSNESQSTDLDNIRRLNSLDQLKFVVGDRPDYEYAVKIMKTYCQHISGDRLLFSPVAGKLDPAEMASWILNDRLNARLQLQIHKILWPDESRGK
ncbi:MAG: radical SAM protein [Deltaproteobacteria bacterium]|nr:radical SAM protein [Deltaproteobacteria bacterium]